VTENKKTIVKRVHPSVVAAKLINLYRQYHVITGGIERLNKEFIKASEEVLEIMDNIAGGKPLKKHIRRLQEGKTPKDSIHVELLPYSGLMHEDCIEDIKLQGLDDNQDQDFGEEEEEATIAPPTEEEIPEDDLNIPVDVDFSSWNIDNKKSEEIAPPQDLEPAPIEPKASSIKSTKAAPQSVEPEPLPKAPDNSKSNSSSNPPPSFNNFSIPGPSNNALPENLPDESEILETDILANTADAADFEQGAPVPDFVQSSEEQTLENVELEENILEATIPDFLEKIEPQASATVLDEDIIQALIDFTPDYKNLENIKNLFVHKGITDGWQIALKKQIEATADSRQSKLAEQFSLLEYFDTAIDIWNEAQAILSSPKGQINASAIKLRLPDFEKYLGMFGTTGEEILVQIKKLTGG
jgi:hypothetical protein